MSVSLTLTLTLTLTLSLTLTLTLTLTVTHFRALGRGRSRPHDYYTVRLPYAMATLWLHVHLLGARGGSRDVAAEPATPRRGHADLRVRLLRRRVAGRVAGR